MSKHTRTKTANAIKGRNGTDATRSISQNHSTTVHNIAPNETGNEYHFDSDSDSRIEKLLKPLVRMDETETELKRIDPSRDFRIASQALKSISSPVAADFSSRLIAFATHRTTIASTPNPKLSSSMDEELEQILSRFESESRIQLEKGPADFRLKSLLQHFVYGKISVFDHDQNCANTELANRCSDAIHIAIAAISSKVQFQDSVQRECRKAIYSFAYGLSHEINNPLANIAARAQQLIASANSEADRRSLATIVDQTMRAHEMLSEMMRVVQPRPLNLRIENVGRIVEETLRINLVASPSSKIRMDLKVADKPVYAAADRSALAEAVQSILQNAMQACGPNDRIQIVCEDADANASKKNERASRNNASDAEQIRISISDTGPGLSPESTERAWDLYYSGREHGRGLGISLANVRRIVDAHHGEVWIESAPGAGCVVEIRLPKSTEPPAARKLPKR